MKPVVSISPGLVSPSCLLFISFLFFFLLFSPLSQQCLGGVSLKVREGSLFFLNPPCPLPHGPLGGFVCACVLKCVDRWLQGGDELKEVRGRRWEWGGLSR